MEKKDFIYSSAFGPEMTQLFKKKKKIQLNDDDIVTYDGFEELKKSAGTIILPDSDQYKKTASKLGDELADAIRDNVFQDSKINVNKVANWCALANKFGKERNFKSKVLDKFKDWKISDVLRICYAEISANGCVVLHISILKVKLSIVIDIPSRKVYVAGVDPAEAEEILDKLPEKAGLPENMDLEQATTAMKAVSDAFDPKIIGKSVKGKRDPLYEYLHDKPKGIWTSETIRIAKHYSPEFDGLKFIEELNMLTKEIGEA